MSGNVFQCETKCHQILDFSVVSEVRENKSWLVRSVEEFGSLLISRECCKSGWGIG